MKPAFFYSKIHMVGSLVRNLKSEVFCQESFFELINLRLREPQSPGKLFNLRLRLRSVSGETLQPSTSTSLSLRGNSSTENFQLINYKLTTQATARTL